MVSDGPRSLPDWIEQAYEILHDAIGESDDELTGAEAREVLVGHDSFPDDRDDATYAIDRLLDTGWLYEVDDELRITDPEQ